MSPQSHTNTDLAGLTGDNEGRDAVKAHGGKQHREASEGGGQRRQKPLIPERSIELIIERHERINWERRIDLLDGCANRGEGGRGRRSRPDVEAAARGGKLEERKVRLVLGLAEPAIAEGLDDADDLHVSFGTRRVPQPQPSSDGAPVAEVALCEALVHDGRTKNRSKEVCSLVASVSFVERAAAEKRHADALEEAGRDGAAVTNVPAPQARSGIDPDTLVPTAPPHYPARPEA